MNASFPGDFENDPCPEFTDEQLQGMIQASHMESLMTRGIKLTPQQRLEYRRLAKQGYAAPGFRPD
jgi:hypothetical protein